MIPTILMFLCGVGVGAMVVGIVSLGAIRESERIANTYFQRYLEIVRWDRSRRNGFLAQEERERPKADLVIEHGKGGAQ